MTGLQGLILEMKVGTLVIKKWEKEKDKGLCGFLQLGLCDGLFGRLMFFVSLFLHTPVTRKTHKQIQLDQAVETWIEI